MGRPRRQNWSYTYNFGEGKIILRQGKNFMGGGGGDYSENGGNRRRSEIFQASKKRSSKIYGTIDKKKPGGAANLGSAPGGRHPIYATGS